MPKIVDSKALRRDILRAARSVFAERGMRGTGLTHVARAAGMGRSSLYHYYPDKDSLVADLLADMLAEEEALFRAMLNADGPARERIETFLRSQIDLFEAWCQIAPLVFDLRAAHAERLRPFFRRVRRNLAEVIAEGQEAGAFDPGRNADLAASTIIGAIDGLLLQFYVDRRAFGNRRELADELATQVLRGLAK